MKKALQALALTLFTYPAFATITPYIPANSPLVLPDGTIVGDLIQFEPTPADALWHVDPANGYIGSQGLGSNDVELFAESLIQGDLTFLYGLDSLSGHELSTFSGTDFNVVALHYANKELVFYYETAIDTFTIGDIYAENGYDLNQEVSNIRVFSGTGTCCVTTTSVNAPGTVALLSLGLLGLYTARKQRV